MSENVIKIFKMMLRITRERIWKRWDKRYVKNDGKEIESVIKWKFKI